MQNITYNIIRSHSEDHRWGNNSFSESKSRFHDISQSTSPVKLKKFRIDTMSNSEDILMGQDVCVEECLATFDKVEMPTTLTLSKGNKSHLKQKYYLIMQPSTSKPTTHTG